MMSEPRSEITPHLVRRLIDDQFPEYRNLVISRVALDGWDNRTFRLGDRLSVRMPSATGYVPQVAKEQRWLPILAPHLPLPIPVPVAVGQASAEYPFPWSINRWLPGTPLALTQVDDHIRLARELGGFLGALYRVPDDGPVAGAHSFYRGGSLTVYDEETRQVIAQLGSAIDTVAVTRIWEEALTATWSGPAVWVHGDVAVGNLLIEEGRLAAVIDFGCSAVGDPACDTVMAWTYFTGESRAAFRHALPVSSDTWIRGRGWALWKALVTINGAGSVDPKAAVVARRVLDEVLTNDLSESDC